METTTNKKLFLFEKMPIPRAVFTLAIPSILSSLVMILYNLADTYFVSILNNPIQNTAVTLAAPILLAFNAINNLFGVGTSSMMSRALGRNDFDTVHKSSAIGFWCAVFCGLLFSIACTAFKTPLLTLLGGNEVSSASLIATSSYIRWTVTMGAVPAILNVVMSYLVRSEGSALHASIGTMSGCILNIILDPIFILPWGLNMGAAGAGLATFISNCVACIYFFVLLFVKRKNTYVSISPKDFTFDRKILFGIAAVGIPASIQNILNVTGMTILNNFTATAGGDIAVSAMGIANKIQMIPMYISMGISQGIMPLISYNFSSGDADRLKKSLLFSVKIAIAFIVFVSIGYLIWAEPLMRLFIKNTEIVHIGSKFLRGLTLALPFLCMDFIGVAVFQACGMGGKSLIFAILRKVVLEIPAIYILNKLFPLYGLSYAQFCAEIILGIAAVFLIIRICKNLNNSSGSKEVIGK